MKWTREEYIALMTFDEVPRPMFSELFGLLIGLEDKWRAEGASVAPGTIHSTRTRSPHSATFKRPTWSIGSLCVLAADGQ